MHVILLMNKKRNNSGFTLIELLAVITIMGILMLVAIPSISILIDNSRKDTYASTAGEILSSVKKKYASDDIVCHKSTDFNISGINNSTVYVPFGIPESGVTSYSTDLNDILDGGAASPYGKSKLTGYIKIEINNSVPSYKIAMADALNNALDLGTGCELKNSQLVRNNVKKEGSSGACTINKLDNALHDSSPILCTIN